jgi:hypothetical protein
MRSASMTPPVRSWESGNNGNAKNERLNLLIYLAEYRWGVESSGDFVFEWIDAPDDHDDDDDDNDDDDDDNEEEKDGGICHCDGAWTCAFAPHKHRLRAFERIH